ncbi:Hypothetical predicted protein [Olea europaea subsp. europaea]|uniref:Mal d 1-associated protein n=1 Tax=Olea europaea subsp. europaea TaxID=158383 RepID=A0A8S0UVW4_OLEEU|nr:Hypothetical predicted protein [Olea europaea subsp. europaea]
MGWVWKNDDESDSISSSAGDSGEFNGSLNPRDDGNGDHCATRRILSSQCRTEEVEPGKFIRKCEKTEKIFKDCVGRPSEMVQSNKEYTEEDVTDHVVKGIPLESSEQGPFHFPGLRGDIEAIERSFFGGINRFFEAAEEMKNDFFSTIAVPRIFDDESSSSRNKRGIPVEAYPPKEALPEKNSNGDVDLSGLARDV